MSADADGSKARRDARTNARRTAAAKAVIAIVLLVLVLRKVDLRDVAHKLASIAPLDLLLLFALTIAQVSVGVVRWWRILRRLGERVSWLSLYGDALVGLTYNTFLPTTVGGDVIRAWRARARFEVPHRAWSTTLYERIAGLLAMAGSGAIGVVVASTLPSLLGTGVGIALPSWMRWTVGLCALAFFAAFMFASKPFALLVALLEKRLATSTAVDDFRGIVGDLEGPLAAPSMRLETLGWSLLYQLLGTSFVIEGARSLGDSSHALALVIGVPIVLVLSMVPLTIGGYGLREGLFVGVLGLLGISHDVALGVALQWLASTIFFAIAGAIVTLVAPSSGEPTAQTP